MKCYDILLNNEIAGEVNPFRAFYEDSSKGERAVYMTVYAPDAWENGGKPLVFHLKRPCVVLCPGGGYHLTYEGEGEPVALKFVAAGAVVFELRYSVMNTEAPELMKKGLYPWPLFEVLQAISYARTHAEEFGIDPHNISVMGFSAGAHVAGMASTLWNKEKALAALGGAIDPALCRPDKSILCYGVLSSGEYKHVQSLEFLLGEQDSPEMRELVDCVEQIDAETPPAFLWHCLDDACVPPQNSLLYAAKLRSFGIDAEMHFYSKGGHGQALGTYLTSNECAEKALPLSDWMEHCIEFVLKQVDYVGYY